MNEEGTEMDELKQQLKQESRRHSNKLIKKLNEAGFATPEIIKDSIHQETLYATMDGYRTTMKLNRNGESANEYTERTGNR